MWSSNLLLAYSLQKLNREKRERQPNWTESEKQLLLSLTRMHQSILENKGSDTMTIKRKSEAWDEIALRMKAAGFNRSKERLKQQLGRIRAAEAKRIKDAIERNLTTEQIKSLNDSNNHSIIKENVKSQKPFYNDSQIELSSINSSSLSTSLPLQEHQYIKSEDSPLIHEKVCSEQELQINSSTYIKPNIINYSIMSACKDNKHGESSKNLANMHFKLQSVQSLAVTNHDENNGMVDGCISEANRICAADVTSTIPCSTVSSNIKTSAIRFESNQNISSGNDENASCSFSASNCQTQQQSKRRLRSIRSNRLRTSFTREQGLRQLYLLRAAVERERLRSLRLQQKRDRILYRKDVEIQNLKLQILRNLTNQNRDSSSINF